MSSKNLLTKIVSYGVLFGGMISMNNVDAMDQLGKKASMSDIQKMKSMIRRSNNNGKNNQALPGPQRQYQNPIIINNNREQALNILYASIGALCNNYQKLSDVIAQHGGTNGDRSHLRTPVNKYVEAQASKVSQLLQAIRRVPSSDRNQLMSHSLVNSSIFAQDTNCNLTNIICDLAMSIASISKNIQAQQRDIDTIMGEYQAAASAVNALHDIAQIINELGLNISDLVPLNFTALWVTFSPERTRASRIQVCMNELQKMLVDSTNPTSQSANNLTHFMDTNRANFYYAMNLLQELNNATVDAAIAHLKAQSIIQPNTTVDQIPQVVQNYRTQNQNNIDAITKKALDLALVQYIN